MSAELFLCWKQAQLKGSWVQASCAFILGSPFQLQPTFWPNLPSRRLKLQYSTSGAGHACEKARLWQTSVPLPNGPEMGSWCLSIS